MLLLENFSIQFPVIFPGNHDGAMDKLVRVSGVVSERKFSQMDDFEDVRKAGYPTGVADSIQVAVTQDQASSFLHEGKYRWHPMAEFTTAEGIPRVGFCFFMWIYFAVIYVGAMYSLQDVSDVMNMSHWMCFHCVVAYLTSGSVHS